MEASQKAPVDQQGLPSLRFSIEGAWAVEHAATPQLGFALRIENSGNVAVRSITLNVQLRIDATRRSYDRATKDRLAELFGWPHEFGRAVRSLLWTQTSAVVPAFSDSTVFELLIGCTYDFEVASAKYLDALRDGDIPVEFLFSGTVFYAAEGFLRVLHVPWDREASFSLPVAVWRQTMERHFPSSAWLRLQKDTFDRLYAYRAHNRLLDWESTLERLLDEAG